jgi:hypothetical protein
MMDERPRTSERSNRLRVVGDKRIEARRAAMILPVRRSIRPEPAYLSGASVDPTEARCAKLERKFVCVR